VRPRGPLKTLIESIVFAAALLMVFFILRIAGFIETETGNAVAVDGDSLKLGGSNIRLHAIDAPEYKQDCHEPDGAPWPCGREAHRLLRSLVQSKQATCRPVDTDKYGRTVAECSVDGRSLNEEMVRQGFAVAYIHHGRKHERLEAEAREAKRGIWRGRFERPEDWRAREKLVRGDAGGSGVEDD
jgi:endonuclease YncB( thermonuclease family)